MKQLQKFIFIFLVSFSFFSCEKDDTILPTIKEPVVLKSISISNPIRDIVISKKHKFVVDGKMSDNTTINVTNETKITSRNKKVTILSDNTILGLKSGIDTLDLVKDTLKSMLILNVKDYEFLEINSELLKNNGATIQVPVIILSYTPTENGVDLDLKQGPDGYHQLYYSNLENVKRKILNESIMAKKIWEEGSRFRNFNTNNSPFQINVIPVHM